MSATCRWCGHRSFSYDGHECDGIRLSREHAELRALAQAVLTAWAGIDRVRAEDNEVMIPTYPMDPSLEALHEALQ